MLVQFRQTSCIVSRAFISFSLPCLRTPTHTQNESHFLARISNPSMFKPLQAIFNDAHTTHSTTDDRHIMDINMRDSASHLFMIDHGHIPHPQIFGVFVAATSLVIPRDNSSHRCSAKCHRRRIDLCATPFWVCAATSWHKMRRHNFFCDWESPRIRLHAISRIRHKKLACKETSWVERGLRRIYLWLWLTYGEEWARIGGPTTTFDGLQVWVNH